MNRFRTRRKAAKEEAKAAKEEMKAAKEDATARLNGDIEPSNPFRLFNKGKRSHDEGPKPIDLSTALPPTDDFRTSLLMTGLSARFSMLREQDDPNTKIGKASDDSVLLPKRQSRLADLSFRGLGDIAEVESIRAPPSLNRMNSYNSSSDADSTNPGGVMTRSRPTEGNVLFGGRQKIYKVGTAASGTGGMGKPLYEDDVALSSFQKWKQAEKEKQALEDYDASNALSDPLSRTSEPDSLRPESPPAHNPKRETGSTTSSAPSTSRISTAATSVASHKDWSSSTTSPSLLEKSTVARTRRLYEQGLNQDLQNQQSHALSRMDTLARRGPVRSPDASQSSSPTGSFFGDRSAGRKLLSKTSAPNMQTAAPLAVPRSTSSPIDQAIRGRDSSETKPPFGAAPPLSPPISEEESSSILPIHPSDRGKATALGVFHKPSKPYDESRFVERQIQLHQGRETPTQSSRPGSDASPVVPETSSIATNPSDLPQVEPAVKPPTEPAAPARREEEEGGSSMTFLDDDDEDTLPQVSPPRQILPHQAGRVRPADEDHPAFRGSALPTPLSFSSTLSDGVQTQVTTPSSPDVKPAEPKDSPTLGPPAGLSGMVRQHLRTDSGSSSIYGADPHPAAPAVNRPISTFNSKTLDDLVADLNPWAAQDQEWRASFYTGNVENNSHTQIPAAIPREQPGPPPLTDSSRQSTSSSDVGKEKDVFHSQLADGARRVRERLTTYVETDGSIAHHDPTSTPEETPRPSLSSLSSPLGGLLRNKSSRGSLVERQREVSNPSKAMKLLGLNNATMSTTPSPNKQSFEEKDHPLSPMQEEPPTPERDTSRKSSTEEQEKDGSVHAGLKQFRQARRELQKLKEAETRQRHQHSPPRSQSRPNQVRSPSRERRPPPVSYSRPPSAEPWTGSGSAPGSRAGSRAGSRPPSRNDRDRSGSETSNGGRAQSRPPPRLRKGPGHEEYGPFGPHRQGSPHGPPHGPHHNGSPHQGPMMRSPGVPGGDGRRPPMVSNNSFQGMHSPAGLPDGRSSQAPGLSPYQQQRGPLSGQPSPISPMGDLPSPYSASGRPNFNGAAPSPRRPSQPPLPGPEPGANTARLDDSMKRVVRKKDISEPTFVSSTSRVPTVSLPEDVAGRPRSRSRSGSLLRSGQATASTPNLHGLQQSQAGAPPVPPINPRRRNVLCNLMGRKDEDDMSLSQPQLPFAAGDVEENRNSAFSISDEEDGKERRRLRKATSEANVRARSGTQRHSPPYFPGAHGAPPVKDNGMPGGLI